MGALFAVPVVRAESLSDLPGTTIAMVAGSGVPLSEALANVGEATIMIGAERDGLPQELIAQAALTAHIPIHADSLNAAMAATVALYEAANRMARAR